MQNEYHFYLPRYVYKLFEILTVVSIAVTKFVLVEGRYAGCMEWVVINRK